MARTLYGLRQSPWTERARWVLDHHGLRYDYHEHVPMLGEVLLRRKAGAKHATVPLLADGAIVVMGSFEIAVHLERAGRGGPLFPRDRDAEVARWADVAERMAQVGRAWALARLAASRDARAEALPSFVPGPLRGAIAPTTAMAVRFLAKKYAVPEDVEGEIARTLRPALDETRAALAGSDYLLPGAGFTYADIALATTMRVLRPRAEAPLGPATREAWTNDALARDYADLLDWRDAVFAKHR